MIKVRYLVQIGFTADVDEKEAIHFEEIKEDYRDITSDIERYIKEEFFDAEVGKIIVTEILNEVTKE